MQSSCYFSAGSMLLTYTAIQTLITNLHNAIVTAAYVTPADKAYMHKQNRLLQFRYHHRHDGSQNPHQLI